VTVTETSGTGPIWAALTIFVSALTLETLAAQALLAITLMVNGVLMVNGHRLP
jgi:hypothetical protein